MTPSPRLLLPQANPITPISIPPWQDKCREHLGDFFPPVYSFLKRARKTDLAEDAVRRELVQLVPYSTNYTTIMLYLHTTIQPHYLY